MSSLSSLDAAAQERKARLAKLKTLKRKQPDSLDSAPAAKQAKTPPPPRAALALRDAHNGAHGTEPHAGAEEADEIDVSAVYLSGRNYDVDARGPRLGFESAPINNIETLEKQAEVLALETREKAALDDKADKPLDLFKLRPRKPNWDLKRDLDRKLEVLNVRTENAIARLVRERVETAQKAAAAKQGSASNGDGDAVGMEGVSLVEAIHLQEREEEEERRRESEDTIE